MPDEQPNGWQAPDWFKRYLWIVLAVLVFFAASTLQAIIIAKFGGQPFSPPDYRNDMPGFEGRLSDADIWAVLAYVKSRWPEAVRERQRELAKERGG